MRIYVEYMQAGGRGGSYFDSNEELREWWASHAHEVQVLEAAANGIPVNISDLLMQSDEAWEDWEQSDDSAKGAVAALMQANISHRAQITTLEGDVAILRQARGNARRAHDRKVAELLKQISQLDRELHLSKIASGEIQHVDFV